MPGGGAVVLDVAQLEALLARTFGIGLDVGRGREKVALVRLRLSRALPGAAGTQAMAAGALAVERAWRRSRSRRPGGWRCTPRVHRDAGPGAAPGRTPGGRGHRLGRARTRPARPRHGMVLDAALQAATGLQQLLAFRHDCTTVTTPAEQAAATAGLTSAAAEALHGLIELAEMTGRSGRTGKTDLN